MVRSNRTCTLVFDTEVEKTGRRLRKEAIERHKQTLIEQQATSSQLVNSESTWETGSEDEGIEEIEEIVTMEQQQPPQM